MSSPRQDAESAPHAGDAGAGPMPRGIELFRVAGIRIRIDYSWFIIFLLILWSLSAGYLPQRHPGQSTAAYWMAGTAATLAFFASILIHELAHSLVALRFGIPIPAITLFLFGGASHMSQEAQDPRKEIWIALAGPATSFALAGLFYGLHRATPGGAPALTGATLGYLAWINAALGVFNLLPGFPLDGGRVFRALAWWKTGSLERATKLASDMGKGLAIGLMLLGGLQIFAGALLGGLWMILIGMFLRGMADAGYREMMLRHALEDVGLSHVMAREVVTVPPELTVERLVDDYFYEYGYRGFPVSEHGKLLGMVSLAQVRNVPAPERGTTRVRECMLPASPRMCLDPDASLTEALERLSGQDLDRLVVVREGRIVGIVTRSGLARFVELRSALGGSV